MTQLALKLKLQKDETIMSFVSRLAARNGPSFVQDFCSDMGLNWQKLIYSDAIEIDRLAGLVDISSVDLIPRALVSIDRRRCKLSGQLLAARSFLRREQKLCPGCVQRDEQDKGEFGVFGRREWLLASFRVCPIHSCQLLTLPRVSFPRHPADFFRRYESCRKLISRHQLISHPHQESTWESYLVERLAQVDGRRWIDQFDLDATMRIVQNLGVIAVYGPNAREAELGQEELPTACRAGFVAASGTEDQVVSALSSVCENSPSKIPGFFSDFGMFARWCSRISTDDRHRQPHNINAQD
ncbi:MAG: TniQ family protein [Sulfitobacter sp.]